MEDWTSEEIVRMYRTAKDKEEEIEILAQLTLSDIDTIIEVLKDNGVRIPKEMRRFKKCVDCGLYILANSRGRRCELCQVIHDRERRRKRYHLTKGARMRTTVDVFNMPENPERFVVARYNEDTNRLWFWSSWGNRDDADRDAEKIKGVVVEVVK